MTIYTVGKISEHTHLDGIFGCFLSLQCTDEWEVSQKIVVGGQNPFTLDPKFQCDPCARNVFSKQIFQSGLVVPMSDQGGTQQTKVISIWPGDGMFARMCSVKVEILIYSSEKGLVCAGWLFVV